MKRTALLALTAAVSALLAIAAGLSMTTASATDKVTICHAAGQAGTLTYVEITAAYEAIYGQAGHFAEPGTPNAGHENDYEGPCKEETSTTEPEVTTTEPEVTTTVPETTTTLPPPPPPAPPADPVPDEPTLAG